MNSKKLDIVVSAIIKENDAILMIWHEKLGSWLFPGGHVEEGETLEMAIIRECMEEIHGDIELVENKIKNITSNGVEEENRPYCILLEPINEIDNYHYHLDFIFMAKIKDKSSIQCNETVRWIKKSDINSIIIFENVKLILNKIL